MILMNAMCVSSGTVRPARLTVKKVCFFFVRGRFVGRRLRPLRSFGLPPLAVNGGGPEEGVRRGRSLLCALCMCVCLLCGRPLARVGGSSGDGGGGDGGEAIRNGKKENDTVRRACAG